MGFKPRAEGQLVLQFPEIFFECFADVTDFANRVRSALPPTARVDGHDIGAGTINILVHTARPNAAFKAVRKHLGTDEVERHLRVAFRRTPKGPWSEMWPRKSQRDHKPFAFL